MIIEDEPNSLKHYGILRRSGRYPWGSGDNAETSAQRSKKFFDIVSELRAEGLSDLEIAKGHGMSMTEFREARSIASAERKAADVITARKYREQYGMSNKAIGEKMGKNESSIRALLAPGAADKALKLHSIANLLQEAVDKHGFVDVGSGVENHLGISKDRLGTALAMLKSKDYVVHPVQQPQLSNSNNKTTIKVLAKPGITYRDVKQNIDKIHSIVERSEDDGISFDSFIPPLQVKASRLAINYKENGGEKADGVVFVRPGVKDLSLGAAHYAQVRIAVAGTHYIKGMAMYKDDLPKGVDLLFNTNKSKADLGPNKLHALKEQEPDETGNPFGSFISRQLTTVNSKGERVLTSAMNIVHEEGNWGEWKKTISSQMLSKQSPSLAKAQLEKSWARTKADLDEIKGLNNPEVKRRLLETFAEDSEASAWRLKAEALPGQRSHVILPVNTMKPTEVFAPNYTNGQRVVLIRFPHAGPFEIPELTVNNNHAEAKSLLAGAKDAIGIHHKVAEQLSGADFDGDTVLVIPNDHAGIRTAPAIKKLQEFNPREAYAGHEGMPVMSARSLGIEMGKISNLITDMTIKGAKTDEIVRAVRHSMVVIDAKKHKLNYKQSALDHGIAALRENYQGKKVGTASTLISRRKQEESIPKRRPLPAKKGGPIDPKSGKQLFEPTGETRYSRKAGDYVPATQKVKKILLTDDVHKLASGTRMEAIYAEHANKMKALADGARKELVTIKPHEWDTTAKHTYAAEVSSLNHKLDLVVRNRPLERKAQLLASKIAQVKKDANPDMDKAEVKKTEYRALVEARSRVGARPPEIKFEGREWEAIQNGAISSSKLREILKKADMDQVRELATPTHKLLMTGSNLSRAKTMQASGRTLGEISAALGISVSTIKRTLEGEG